MAVIQPRPGMCNQSSGLLASCRQGGSLVVHYTTKQGKNSRHPRQNTYAVGEVRTHALIRTSGLKSDALTTRPQRQAIIT